MKDLIVVGAGTSVIVKLIHAINRQALQWNLLGFVDDDTNKWGKPFFGYPVLGGIDLLRSEQYRGALSLCFIYGSTIWTRMKVLRRLDAMGIQYATLVHPSVDLEFVTVGHDCVIQGGSWIQTNISIGNHCGIGLDCVIGHDVTIQDYAWLGPRVTILGRVTVKEGATLGAGAIIKGDITVGEYSLVGMGAVVMEDVPPKTTVMGNPARIINREDLRPRHPY
jgi:sugar O-acyltransferase (sialic acid O-acetyltransferase NeuD family)